MVTARFIIGDTRAVVAAMPDGSVDLIITSPPFLALRSYLPADHPDKALEIGQEPNPAAFIDMLLELTAEWGRVLAPHGSICVELGDTYSGSGGAGGDYNADGLRDGQPKFRQLGGRGDGRYGHRDDGHKSDETQFVQRNGGPGWPLAKSAALIPELYRIGLAYGINPLTGVESPAGRWRVRNTVRWCRPNPPVGALGDKYRPSTSDMVIACRSPKRWFDLDAVRTPHKHGEAVARGSYSHGDSGNRRAGGDDQYGDTVRDIELNPAGAPPLDYWVIPTHPYKGSHYATFPPALVTIPIESMCPREVCTTCGEPRRRIVGEAEYVAANGGVPSVLHLRQGQRHADPQVKQRTATPTGDRGVTRVAPTLGWTDCGHDTWRPGVVLDPFGGSGTVGQVATGHGRDAILIDLDERNADFAVERIGMFCTVEHHDKATT